MAMPKGKKQGSDEHTNPCIEMPRAPKDCSWDKV